MTDEELSFPVTVKTLILILITNIWSLVTSASSLIVKFEIYFQKVLIIV